MLHILVGADPDARARVRAAVTGGASTRAVTVNPDEAGDVARVVAQVGAVPLFGSPTPAEVDLGERADSALLRALADSGALVLVAVTRRPAASLLAELGERVRIHDTGPASPAQQRSRVQDLLGAGTVRYTPDAARYLQRVAEHDLSRARSVIAQLGLLGRPEVGVARLARLCGTFTPLLLPWELADALLAGDPAPLAELVTRAEPVAAWAALGRLLTQLQAVNDTAGHPGTVGSADSGTASGPGVPAAVPERVRRRLSGLLGQLDDPAGVVLAALGCWVAADRLIKSDPEPPGQLLAATARLSAILARPDAPSAIPSASGPEAPGGQPS
jgi:hypothetical protein